MKKVILALAGCVLVAASFLMANEPRCEFKRVPKMKITDSKGKEFVMNDVLVTFPCAQGDIVLPSLAFKCIVGDAEVDLPFDDFEHLFYLRRYDESSRIYEARLCNGKIRQFRIINNPISFVGKVNCIGREVEIDFADVRRLVVLPADAE